MSSLRDRQEIRESLAREEKPVQKPEAMRRNAAPVAVGNTSDSRTRAAKANHVPDDAGRLSEAAMDKMWNDGVRQEKERHRQAIAAREARERADAEARRKAGEAETTKQAQAQKAAQEFNRSIIESLVAGLTLQQVGEIEQYIAQHYAGRENDSEIWEFVLNELRGQADIEQSAREAFMKIPLTTIDAKTDAELAEFLNCSQSFAATLREEI